jgi:O-antigen ligase
MTAMTHFRAKALDPQALERLADWLAVAVAVSLPWSTTATGILVVCWLLALLPTLEIGAVRRELVTAAGALPVLLFALAMVGMLWADVPWSERLGGLAAYHRLLALPLLLTQFRRSEHGLRVVWGFFVSVSGVLLLSWAVVLFPSLPLHPSTDGVPVKDYVLQSGDFLLCAFALFAIALDCGEQGRWRSAIGPVALAALFLANIAFVAAARTTLLVAPVLALLLGWRQFRWKGLVGAGVLFCILGGAAVQSPYLHARLSKSLKDYRAYLNNDADNPTAEHLEFLRKSLSFVETAPVIGHGTGSIAEQFRKSVIGKTGVAGLASVNPHNQILAVAIQLGLVGAAVLVAMWIAHFMLFRGASLTAWFGTLVVTQNVVSSLVNSHLFDFTQGWLYVFGVGVTGGMVLRERTTTPSSGAQGAGQGEGQPAEIHESDPITA